MNRLVLILALVVWSVPASAEVTVIYRKSDRTVAGWVTPPQSVAVEIDNITKSELGGKQEDYATVEVPDELWAARGNQLIRVTADGQAALMQNPKVVERAMARESAIAKLRLLGLNKEEIEALANR